MSNSVNWRGIFGSSGFGFLLLIGLAAGTAANAAPICKSQVNGNQATVTVADTGMVWSDGAQPPVGLITYPGTGRTDDIAASCSDNAVFCKSAKWFLRFADSNAGWVSDNDLGNDSRAVACTYDSQARAQVCTFEIVDGMKPTNGGKPRMDFSVRLPNGQVVAAYQPQSGCPVEKDGRGNPHAIVSTAKN